MKLTIQIGAGDSKSQHVSRTCSNSYDLRKGFRKKTEIVPFDCLINSSYMFDSARFVSAHTGTLAR